MFWNAGVVNELQDNNLGTACGKLPKFQEGSEVDTSRGQMTRKVAHRAAFARTNDQDLV